MTHALAAQPDPFRVMLLWSGVLHGVLFAGFVVTARLSQPAPVLAQPSVAWIVPGGPGPAMGSGGGGAPPQPTPREPAESPEPKKEEPRVVRPTKEDRDQLPMPDARPARNRKDKNDQPSSGLIGKDQASAASAQLAGGTGIAGLGLGGTGGGSAFDQDFEYAYYVQQMLARINTHWQRIPVRGQAVVVIIRFTIFRDGHLEAVGVEQSSGVQMLDRAAERAVLLSDPLPPLPDTYPRDQVGVHLQFVYSDQG